MDNLIALTPLLLSVFVLSLSAPSTRNLSRQIGRLLYLPFRWFGEAVLDKIDLRAKVREFFAHIKEGGLRFAVPAFLWTLFEDYVLPGLCVYYKQKALAAFFFFMHFEAIAYPTIWWVLLTYDRLRGRKTWAPERPAMSTYTRTNVKVLSHQLVIGGALGLLCYALALPSAVFLVYFIAMSFVDYIHDRVWHEVNWGIREDDSVEWKRIAGKLVTHGTIDLMVLSAMFKLDEITLRSWPFGLCVAATLGLYLALETLWARSAWGIVSSMRVSAPVEAKMAF